MSSQDKFVGDLEKLNFSQCLDCLNWAGFGNCLAFPDGVPDAILKNEHDHTKPFNGDRGILFDPIPPKVEEPS